VLEINFCGVSKHTNLLFPAANDKEKGFIKLTLDGGIPLDGVVELEENQQHAQG